MERQRLAIVALALLTGGYLVQLASPLRTNTDATVFLDLAATASDGGGFLVDGKPTHFPIGYPIVLAALDRAGLACSASFIGLNLLALAGGLAATAFVLRRSFHLGTTALLAIACSTLLCWVFIKHVTLPLSDLPYFGLAQASLALMTWSTDRPLRSRMAGLGLAAVLVSAAIAIRTVGVALLPALIFASMPPTSPRRLGQIVQGRRGVALAIGLIGLAALACPPIVRTQYFREFLERWNGSIGAVELARYKLSDWGELILNTSAAKLPDAFRGVVVLAGTLVPIMLAWGARLRDRVAIVDVYLLGYLGILLAWPYQDARFWMPVFPIFLGYVELIRRRHAGVAAVRWGGVAYLATFSLIGVVGLAYSTWISMGRDRFAERFAGGVYRDSYHAAWDPTLPTGDPARRIDPQIVRLVQRYSSPPR